ncbi:alternative ribosome rescue aminoacyl-tRNA hydrolase ArfB [Thermobifida cellulosilytica]|uniref:Peptide chain release factor 1 n=1 Tax=Thermobifida cellulosilytica TB100 TaxID=665004 RepID=A0A147KMP2_THECS|nr:alternative ribosome rescue aminoacyl-tRNA hydrolase ArfB [Thermobifida cellulosilytica]KUP98546.1 peptide chain release factor 1 [Thermobifida cellulosilytica TB100]
MGDPHGAPAVELREEELVWRFSRSSGPGGQHVNTSDTRVSLSLDVTTTAVLTEAERERALRRLGPRLVDGMLTVSVQDFRSQARNREAARQRLAALLGEAARPPARGRRPTRPTRAAKERRLREKRRRSALKRARSGRYDD